MMGAMARIAALSMLARGVVLLVALCGCDEASDGPTVIVFAAASCTDLVTAAADRFEHETGIAVTCSFASSSTLARQVEAGAPADVYLSAHPQWIDRLEKADLVEPGTRLDLLANLLVLIVPTDDEPRIEWTAETMPPPNLARFAIADPAHVPAGIYAKQALQSLGWWDALEGRIITAPDVRATLRLVERGEADAGIVYRSDAARSDHVTARMSVPAEAHDRIRYPLVLLRGAPDEARRFHGHLAQLDAALIASFGFESAVSEAVAP
jgi:molybdate transport system substrate-binding protein